MVVPGLAERVDDAGHGADASILRSLSRRRAVALGARGRRSRATTSRARLGAAELLAIASGERDRPELRRSLWQSIEGALGSTHGAGPLGASSASTGPATLIGLLDSAIGAYMTELGRIALEMDQHGDRDAVSRLAPLHPGEQGSGSIDVGTVGAFRQLQIHFRGEIAHPDGRAPAVVALFYLLPDATRPPIPGRLLIPTAGAEPSFRAEVATATGARETRDYGWRPRLTRWDRSSSSTSTGSGRASRTRRTSCRGAGPGAIRRVLRRRVRRSMNRASTAPVDHAIMLRSQSVTKKP